MAQGSLNKRLAGRRFVSSALNRAMYWAVRLAVFAFIVVDW
jgi:hypothetical protein